jgi:lipoprotein-releasing system permease protein
MFKRFKFKDLGFELFIAKRLQFHKRDGKEVSRPAVRIAVGGIAVGLAVMILAVAIVIGFKKEVRNKLIGFGSHVQIVSMVGKNFEAVPLSFSDDYIERIKLVPNVKHVQKFAFQGGILKTKENFQGVVLKGVDDGFDWEFFKTNLVEGDVLNIRKDSICKDILISKKQANLLNLKVGDKFQTYFIINGKVRVRPFTVKGIYSTGFNEYDKMIVLGDIRHIRKLNNWGENLSGGLEILIDDYDNLDVAYDELFYAAGNQVDENGSLYMIQSIKDINPQIFSWLDLLDINVVIILLLMVLVSGFTMISGLLILILEKTNMIGLLKAMGCQNWSIRKIFLIQSFFLIGKGMLIGNAVALVLCFVQSRYGLIKLDPDVYYVSAVPVDLNVFTWLLINVCALAVSLLMLIGPSFIITKISPAKAIQFE